MEYVPDVVLDAKVTLPSISILKGPVVIGVTSTFPIVTVWPFKVSFDRTFNTIIGVSSVITITGPSFTASITSTGTGVLVEVLFTDEGSTSLAAIVAVLA